MADRWEWRGPQLKLPNWESRFRVLLGEGSPVDYGADYRATAAFGVRRKWRA